MKNANTARQFIRSQKRPSLPYGEYDYTITDVEWEVRKEDGCPIAVVSFLCDNGTRKGIVTDRISMDRESMWKLTRLFASTGMSGSSSSGVPMRVLGEPILGITGRCVVRNRKIKRKTVNEIGHLLKPRQNETGDTRQPVTSAGSVEGRDGNDLDDVTL
jgi:hypothetical protein